MIERSLIHEIRRFRRKRIKKVKNNEALIKLDKPGEGEAPVFILHLIPEKVFEYPTLIELSSLYKDLKAMEPIYSTAWNGKYNSNGFVTYGHSIYRFQGSVGSYVQFFHNGIIEAVDLRLLHEGYLRGQLFKRGLIEALPRFLATMAQVGVEPPVYLMISFLNVYEFPSDFNGPLDSHRIEEQNLFLPQLKISDMQCDIVEALKPIFDIVWHAAGQPDSSL
ncbi:MAG: hypothetical protein U5L07_08545 [Desulfobacterales bacterium]|nr:hypothetical protein [Desulfobacterales bacterium]